MGSPWRDKISLAILELQEKGEIQMLYDKWWKGPKDTCTAEKARQSNKANALGVNNIGGVFVVLLCGLAFAVLIAILEFCHNSRRQQKHLTYIDNVCVNSTNNYLESDSTLSQLNDGQNDNLFLHRQSLFSDMTDELCLAFRCQGNHQRAAFKRQCANCQLLQKQSFQQKQSPNETSTKSDSERTDKFSAVEHAAPPTPPPPPPPMISNFKIYNQTAC